MATIAQYKNTEDSYNESSMFLSPVRKILEDEEDSKTILPELILK